jgi:signal transduction histidine kinase/sugar lactone lactonase YvrE
VFNPTTGAARTYVNNPALPSSLSENIVWDVVSTRSRQLWVATQNGLNLFHPETQDFTRFVEDSYRSDNGRLPNNYVNTLYEDTQGRLWIGMYGGGVCVIDHLKRKFDIVRRETLSNPLQTLPDNNIWAAYQDKNNIVWVGTVRGLAAYNPTTKTIRAFHNDTLRLGSMSDNINFISGDSTGKIWCSTFGGGVNVFDTTKKRFSAHYGFQEGNVRSLPNDRVTAVYCSKQGELWIGTINGACRYVPKTNDFEPCFTGAKNSQELSHPTIKYFFEDSKGRFWIGTASGLNLVNLQTGTVTRFKSIPNDTTTLSHNNIRQIIEDKQHRIWIATSGGLNLLLESASDKPQDIAFKRITTANGLPSNHISGVLADEQNTLWIPHSSGVCSFDPASFRVVREFDTEDGLQGQEFRATAALNLHDGRLFFGGSNGFNTFNPASLLTDSTKPRIVFTNFKVFNQVRKLPVSITETREITLSHKDYIFSLEFAALDFTNSAKTRYAYKMEGFDQDWVQNGELRSATYTNLRGGEYLFRVKASNHDGVWNEEGIALKITIIPPLWETWWFRGLSIGAVVLLLFFGVRLRVRVVKQQNALLESTVAERTAALLQSNHQLSEANEQLRLANVEKNEFLGIVAHDLKNPLSTIKLAAKLMNEEAPNLEVSDFREITADILTTSNRMFDLITNLLDVNRLEQNAVKFTPLNIDVVPMLHHSVAQFTPLADAKALEILLETPKSSVIAFADESATMQVLDNIVSNAVKYSPQGKKIYCSAVARILENGEQIVQIAVRDEGPGLSEEDMKKLFGKFARLSAQPTGGEHSTGLGLSIVKKMVEAMNGRVYCVSTLGHGATFIVELPQGA